MRRIKLSKGKFSIVDNSDYERLSKHKWSYNSDGKAVRTEYPSNRQIPMAREIMGFPKGLDVDHINGNRLDNRRINLRSITHSQNCLNIHKEGYKGIEHRPKKKRNQWISYITFRHRKIHIGCHPSKVKAAKAYDEKAKELFGEFANLNLKEKAHV